MIQNLLEGILVYLEGMYSTVDHCTCEDYCNCYPIHAHEDCPSILIDEIKLVLETINAKS